MIAVDHQDRRQNGKSDDAVDVAFILAFNEIANLILLHFIVNEDNIHKNINQISKAMKHLEVDIKIAKQNKSTPANDRFVPVMEISFLVFMQYYYI